MKKHYCRFVSGGEMKCYITGFCRIVAEVHRDDYKPFGGSNYQFGQNCGVHIEPGPDGGIVVLDDTTIYDMAYYCRFSHHTTLSLPSRCGW